MPVQSLLEFKDLITEDQWKELCNIRNFQNGPDHPESGKLIPLYGCFGLLVNGEWIEEHLGGNIKNSIARTLFENGFTAQDYIQWHDKEYHDEYIRWHNENYS